MPRYIIIYWLSWELYKENTLCSTKNCTINLVELTFNNLLYFYSLFPIFTFFTCCFPYFNYYKQFENQWLLLSAQVWGYKTNGEKGSKYYVSCCWLTQKPSSMFIFVLYFLGKKGMGAWFSLLLHLLLVVVWFSPWIHHCWLLYIICIQLDYTTPLMSDYISSFKI